MDGFYKKWLNENEEYADKEREDPSDEGQEGLFKDTDKSYYVDNNLEGSDPVSSKQWSLWGFIRSTRRVFTVTNDKHTNQPVTSEQHSKADEKIQNSKGDGDQVKEKVEAPSDEVRGLGSEDTEKDLDLDNNLEGKHHDYKKMSLQELIENSKRILFGKGSMEVDQSLLMEEKQLQQLISVLLQSADSCPDNLLDEDPHPIDQVLVMFAQLVYIEKNPGEEDAAYSTRILSGKLHGWKILITAANKDWFNGYFGAAFVHTGLQQVVVAHRGTNPCCPGAVYTDLKGIFGTNYTYCMNSATTFVDQIRQAIHSINNQHRRHYTLAITGHSLGAWLAQITSFSVKYLAIKHVGSQICLEKNPEVGIHAKTVGFDSPGARDMLDRVLDDHYDRYEGNLLDGLDITVYLSAPNHINTCGMHLGKIYRISNDVSNLICEDEGTFKYTSATHAISNFIDAFKYENWRIGEVSDWAKSHKEFKELFKILNWENAYHGHAKIDNPNDLKKIHRYKVAEVNSPENVNSFRVFSMEDLQMLNRMQILQEQTSKLTILNEFINNNKLKVESTKLLPKFDLDHYNRTITCASGESLVELCKRLKQLMRWLKPQFTQAIEEQIKVLKQPADFIYYVEGQSYLDSLPKCWLNFTDSVGFQDFLASSTEQVLCLSANSGDGAFQISRLWNILHQMEESNEACDGSIKFTNKNHFTFVRQSQLQNLVNYYGWPVEKEYLMVIDCTLSPIAFIIQLLKDVYDNNITYSKSLKLVLIVSQSIDAPNFSNFCKTINFASDVCFSDLTPDSQRKLFNQGDVIITRDKAYSFREFLEDDFFIRDLNQILSSECLKNFATINNFAINIEDTRPTLGEIRVPFFKLNIKTSMEFFASCVKSPNINILVVMSGLSREDLEIGASWDQLQGVDIILAKGDAQLTFRDTCKKNQEKTIYLFEVLGQDVYCKEIFNGCFYLHRKFLHRSYIDMKKFTETEHADDLFVVDRETNKKSLLNLIKDCTKREAFINNVIIADRGELEVFKQYRKNKRIHFVKINRCEKGYKLEWRYSHGSLESLFPCMSTDSSEPIEEITLSETDQSLVIIADEPGMGKTTFLTRLSRLAKAPWVIYIQLKYFQVHIDKLPEVLTTKSVARFLLSKCCSQADSLLEHLLRSKTNNKRVVLLFDGFDEIDDYIQKKESSKDKLIKLFVFLQGTPAVQTFITTRNYLKKSLEEQLRQTSTCFIRISTQEQQDYFFFFWRSCLSLELGGYGEEEEGRLKEYAGEVLRKAKEVLGPDMDRFMGVPLQLRMLAEVFRPQSGLLQQSLEDSFKQINIINLPNLYKKFVDLKYEIYLHEKTSKDEKLDKEEFNSYLEHVTKTHGKLAFRLFFPNFYDENFDPIEDKWLNKLNRHGLVQSERNAGFQFVHQTYAEYCCAEMVIYLLNQPKSFSRYDLFKEVLVPQILLHPDSKNIRLFMNMQLHENQLSKKALELNAKCICKLWLKDSAIFRNQEHQTALHIAVLEKNEQIVRFLLSGLNIESAQEAFVSLITQYDLDNNTALNMLEKPKPRGDNLVLDGLTTTILQCIKTCSDETNGKIFFACLFNRNESNSREHTKMTVETEEGFIFRRLFNRNNITAPRITEEELVVVNLFGKIIRKYVNRISKIIDRIKEVEILAIANFSWAIQHNVVTVNSILHSDLKNDIERYCLLLMKHKVHDSQTSLHIAVRRGDLRMVKLLAEQTVPFSVLMAQGHRKMTPLHAAAEQGRLNIVTYLVEKGADINAVGNVGWTALYYAALEGCFPIVEYLLQQGADLNKLDWGRGTVLTRASQKGEWDLVRLLLERGADVNADEGEALTYAILQGEWSIVKALVEKGAAVTESLVWKTKLFGDSNYSENEKKMSEFRKKFPSFKFAKEC